VKLLCHASHLHAELLEGEPALGSARRALAIAPGDAYAHFLEGRALALQGDLRGARAAMQQTLTLAPDHAAAQRALAMIDDALARA
jgi:Flp pilus assembly protein TadD